MPGQRKEVRRTASIMFPVLPSEPVRGFQGTEPGAHGRIADSAGPKLVRALELRCASRARMADMGGHAERLDLIVLRRRFGSIRIWSR